MGNVAKLPVNNFEWIEDTSQFNEDFIKNYNKESDEGCFPEVDVQYLQKFHEPQNDLPLLPERMKIKKLEKLVASSQDKTEYVIHIRNLKQALNHGLVLKVHKMIKFNQNAWLKPYIDINTDLRKKVKNDFEKDLLKFMNKVVFGKYQENVTKHRYKTCHSRKKKESFSIRTKFSYYKVFHRKFISNRNEKTEILMNKSVCLGLSIIELSEVVMII